MYSETYIGRPLLLLLAGIFKFETLEIEGGFETFSTLFLYLSGVMELVS
jgi:hypothetical protein